MDELIGFTIGAVVLYILLLLAIQIVMGVACMKIVHNKGYNENWFLWGFFFGMIAILVALTKPDINTSRYGGYPIGGNMPPMAGNVPPQTDSGRALGIGTPTAPGQDTWVCNCGKRNLKSATFCAGCGKRDPDSIWVCKCGNKNEAKARYCRMCGTKKPLPQKQKKKEPNANTGVWICRNCGKKNPNTSRICMDCETYK